MDIFETSKLLLFIAFVIPGFVSIKTYEVITPSAPRSASDRVIDAIAYSCINYAILYLPIRLVERYAIESRHPVIYNFFWFFVILVFPAVLAFAWRYARRTQFFLKNAPHPTEKPWDYVFQQKKSYWMKVTLVDGTIIAGVFSDKSFASSAPAEEQIYLEEIWKIDQNGKYERKINNSAGAIILAKSISHIELRDR